MHERFETVVFIIAACALVILTGYVYFTSKFEPKQAAGERVISHPASFYYE